MGITFWSVGAPLDRVEILPDVFPHTRLPTLAEKGVIITLGVGVEKMEAIENQGRQA